MSAECVQVTARLEACLCYNNTAALVGPPDASGQWQTTSHVEHVFGNIVQYFGGDLAL